MLSARDLFVNQSALTGEPYPVEKTAAVSDPVKALNEAEDYIFLRTSVVSGYCDSGRNKDRPRYRIW